MYKLMLCLICVTSCTASAPTEDTSKVYGNIQIQKELLVFTNDTLPKPVRLEVVSVTPQKTKLLFLNRVENGTLAQESSVYSFKTKEDRKD